MACKIAYILCGILTAVLVWFGFSYDITPKGNNNVMLDYLPPVAIGEDLVKPFVTTNGVVVEPSRAPASVALPDRLENIILRWIMFVMSVFTALTGLSVFLMAKIAEVRRAAYEHKLDLEARMTRQDERADKAVTKAEAVAERVEAKIDEKIAKAVEQTQKPT